jgi:hypothetical protein
MNNNIFEVMMQSADIVYCHREWFRRETRKYKLHPVVEAACDVCRPDDWQQLLLEWPHVAESDPSRLAYTRDERAGVADRQTVTTIGKYLFRHFSNMPDHKMRDLAALYGSISECRFVHTMAEMLFHLKRGPSSCMSGDREHRCDDGVMRHPYEVYDPNLGWHMAVRVEAGQTVGRALCCGTTFVRSYKYNPHGGGSPTDETLEAWLEQQGYIKEYAWEGQKIRHYVTKYDGTLAPFLDGENKCAAKDGDCLVIGNSDDAEYQCDNTCGTASERSDRRCEDCGDRVEEDDGYWVNAGEDTLVCDSCCDNNYTYALSRRGWERYINSENVIFVESQDAYYDEDYLDVNNIVQLENGDYEHTDNAVEIDGEWYRHDDDDVVCDHNGDYQLLNNCVQLENGEYALTDEAWMCAASADWYLTDDVEPVIVDDKHYHPDCAPAQETEIEGE